MRYIQVLLVALLLAGCASSGRNGDGQWTYLFENGIDNWIQRNGTASYRLENGELIGVTAPNTPNSFLSPPAEYGDFILEYEAKIDNRINSGVQIRSESKPEYNNGRVHGYQVELDPSDRAWTAGIYDEARRGWLYDLKENTEAGKAFKKGDWNKIRVEAIGNTIRTWINGKMAANLIDDMTPRGFIAFQVHGIGNKTENAGAEVRWRNARIMTENLEANRLPVDPKVPAKTAPKKTN